jgi:thiol-disulfide isomerase/thioredoxin
MLKTFLTLAVLLCPLSINASEIKEFALAKPVEIPNIQFSDDTGVIHNLTDYKGKVVLVNFWATWCEPCIREMPALEKLAGVMEAKDVVVLPISIDLKGVSAVKKFYADQKITGLPVLVDDKGMAFREYKLQALPTSFVLDKNGRLAAKILGEIEWGSKDTHDYLLGLRR